jgi:hypothetical protein
VVVGYQGGTWIPPSLWSRGYLEVLQQDAHAWSEVWLADQGWVRIDPTAWVAPARIQAGLRSGLAGQWADLGLLRQGLPWLKPLTRSWSNLDLAWSQLLQYDQHSQDELMLRWAGPVAQLAGNGAGGGAGPGPSPGGVDPGPGPDRIPSRIGSGDAWIAASPGWPGVHLMPLPGETLPAFCQRATDLWPELGPGLKRLQTSYEGLRFAPRGQGRALVRELGAADRQLAAAASRLGRKPVERPQPPEPR